MKPRTFLSSLHALQSDTDIWDLAVNNEVKTGDVEDDSGDRKAVRAFSA